VPVMTGAPLMILGCDSMGSSGFTLRCIVSSFSLFLKNTSAY
jgi:hypothetical protein